MGVFSAILDLLFPPRCVFCRAIMKGGDTLICPDCRNSLPYTKNGGEKGGESFTVCAAPLYYEGNARESMLRYKFNGAAGYAETYGTLLAGCVQERLSGRYDVISWVPLSRKRLRERGYDQAKLLAEATARELDDMAAGTLEKVKDVEKQSATGSAEKRRANIAGAYRVPDPTRVAGKRVLLIDDIVTTGTTLSECAMTLRSAGAEEVLCAALCRTREHE